MKTITTFPNPSNEKRETSPNINQVLKIKYTPNVSTALNPNKGIINNTNKQVRKKIRGKDVPVRKIKKQIDHTQCKIYVLSLKLSK